MTTKQLIKLDPIKDEIKQKLIDKYEATTFMNTSDINIKLDIKDMINEHIASKNVIEPTVYITTEAYTKMRTLVNKTDTEVGWYGFVTKVPNLPDGIRCYVIEDIVVYPQRVTGATVEQDDDRMFEFEMSLTTEQVNMKRFQGHSHVNMSVTPSGVDEQFYQDLITQVNDYFIVMINNKPNAVYLRFYDVENNIVYNGLELHVMLNDGVDVANWYDMVSQDIKKPEVHQYSLDTSKGWPTTYDLNKDKKKKGRPKKNGKPTYQDAKSYWGQDEDNLTMYQKEQILKQQYNQGILNEEQYNEELDKLWAMIW